jgi:hypothetical protein
LIDLASTPLVRGTPGTLALVVAQLVATCARSARDLPGSSLSARTSVDGDWALVTIADNGSGSDTVAELGDVARALLVPWGASVDAACEPGQGCAFELRLMTVPA